MFFCPLLDLPSVQSVVRPLPRVRGCVGLWSRLVSIHCPAFRLSLVLLPFFIFSFFLSFFLCWSAAQATCGIHGLCYSCLCYTTRNYTMITRYAMQDDVGRPCQAFAVLRHVLASRCQSLLVAPHYAPSMIIPPITRPRPHLPSSRVQVWLALAAKGVNPGLSVSCSPTQIGSAHFPGPPLTHLSTLHSLLYCPSSRPWRT